MIEYPYIAPIILTDTLYTAFGGHNIDTSTAFQRQAAYYIAEIQMTDHLNAFLLPTKVTGTYSWPLLGKPVELDYCYVRTVDKVRVKSEKCDCSCDLDTKDGCAFVISDIYGYVYLKQTTGALCECGCAFTPPFQAEIVFTSGLYSGSSYRSPMLLALTMAAEINLNEIIDQGANEGTGDIGITQFQNQDYREVRVALGRTSFGTSARAQKIANLVSTYRHKKVLRFGW